MRRKQLCAVGMILGMIVALAVPVYAHHSHAAYEPIKLVSVEGTVSEVLWKNPHMWIVLDVPNPTTGKVDKWGFENAGTAAAVNAGITPDVLKPGTKVKIICHPSRDANKTEGLFMGMEINGKVYARGYGTNIRDADK